MESFISAKEDMSLSLTSITHIEGGSLECIYKGTDTILLSPFYDYAQIYRFKAKFRGS